jgi:hypothetical protein
MLNAARARMVGISAVVLHGRHGRVTGDWLDVVIRFLSTSLWRFLGTLVGRSSSASSRAGW